MMGSVSKIASSFNRPVDSQRQPCRQIQNNVQVLRFFDWNLWCSGYEAVS